MNEQTLERLFDRMEITDTSIRYATGIDLRDRKLFRSCFTDEIEMDFSSMGLGDLVKVPADVWVDQAFSLVGGFQST